MLRCETLIRFPVKQLTEANLLPFFFPRFTNTNELESFSPGHVLSEKLLEKRWMELLRGKNTRKKNTRKGLGPLDMGSAAIKKLIVSNEMKCVCAAL